MIYAGYKGKEPLILHNFWSVKHWNNGKMKKLVVGKGVITTL